MDDDDIYDDIYPTPLDSPPLNSTAAAESTPSQSSTTKPKRQISKNALTIIALLVVVAILLFRITLHLQHDPTTSDATFEKDVLKKEQTVYVIFCLPNPDRDSMQMRATLKKGPFFPHSTGNVKPEIFICNITQNFATASKYKATRAPTLSVFQHGKFMGNIVGNKTIDELLEAVNKLLARRQTEISPAIASPNAAPASAAAAKASSATVPSAPK